jgi:hypothetical protein
MVPYVLSLGVGRFSVTADWSPHNSSLWFKKLDLKLTHVQEKTLFIGRLHLTLSKRLLL